MSRRERLHQSLEAALRPSVLEVYDESHMHSVPAGAESHFRVVVVSEAFAGLSRVARHRRLNQLAREELDTGLHALSLQAFTPDEWRLEAKVLESPACLGGGRKSPAQAS